MVELPTSVPDWSAPITTDIYRDSNRNRTMACPVSDSCLGMCKWTGCPDAGATVPSSSSHVTETVRVRAPEQLHPRTTPEPRTSPRPVHLHLHNELHLLSASDPEPCPSHSPSSSTSVTTNHYVYTENVSKTRNGTFKQLHIPNKVVPLF